MQRKLMAFAAAAAGLWLATGPASARVSKQADNGFILHQVAEVPVSPEEAWSRLVKPSEWWSAEHSYSRDAANFSLDPRAGGCFCETLPASGAGEAGALPPPRGSVEHMRVVYVEKPRALRMRGALGPLQQDALAGTLTIYLKPVDGGTRILWEYVVGGFMRGRVQDVSLAADLMLAEQITSLAKSLRGGSDAEALPAKDGASVPEADASTMVEEPDEGIEPPAPSPLDDPNFLGR